MRSLFIISLVSLTALACGRTTAFNYKKNLVTEQEARSATSGIHVVVTNHLNSKKNKNSSGKLEEKPIHLNGQLCAWPSTVAADTNMPANAVCVELFGTIYSASTEHFLITGADYERVRTASPDLKYLNFVFEDSEQNSSHPHACIGGSSAIEEIQLQSQSRPWADRIHVDVTQRLTISYACGIWREP